LTALETVRVQPLSRDATLELARRWEERHRTSADPLVSEETLREAWKLLQQYLSDRHAPGNLLQLLENTRKRLAAVGTDEILEITIDDLVVSLSQLTGLPDTILDERQGLDLSALREFFHRSVKGQTEAIDCLVERVAMLKAGVTDPTRPLGVFLFAGPTGTGKTEMAKTLAHFLFGSPDRMIRVDMSELQAPESLGRLLGEPQDSSDGGASDSVADRIRKQPFSVILLDEFEKAHPRVWDLFLQVFDDGRLTDRRGNLADFRHSIIVLTSNLGAVIPSGVVGFSKGDARFRPSEVERAIEDTFHKEFLNRLDRVVIFQPLNRDTMRQILSKELDDAFRRRGLRNRQWAVEWDDAALEFLLDKGFTSDLGARPVKRAVERYLLTPLAMTIVNHQFPEGDQFLFVKSDGEHLEVEFVDPDAEEPAPVIGGVLRAIERAPVLAGASPTLPLERIVLDASGSLAEIAALRTKLEQIEAHVQNESWQEQKERRLSMTDDPDFWTSPERFAVLGDAEYQDRIERALQTARRLLDRLSAGGKRDRYPRQMVTRVAEQLYLLDAACVGAGEGSPRDAFLEVVAGGDRRTGAEEHVRFARRLGEMYRSWSRKRRMQTTVVAEQGDEATHLLLLSVCGFAAYRLLAPEAGLHVFESPRPEHASLKRATARVRVAPQPDEPLSYKGKKLTAQAAEAFAAAAGAGGSSASGPAIVRRYREEPSPLVRDSVRGWRTGRIDRVFGGDFDLIDTERSRH
jgi:ATP-dependent Clp protease ATP-binding subunit ClpC